MLKVILLLLVSLSNLPSATPCVPLYGQCGGKDYKGETGCCSPSACQYGNEYYSQCLSVTPVASTTTKAPTSATKGSAQGCSAVYGQCGGIGWTGSNQCCTGSACTRNNDYYSQCLPTSGPSTASTSTVKPSTASTSTVKPSTASTSTVKPSTASTSTVKPSTASTSTVKPSTASTSTVKPSPTSVLNDGRQNGVTTRYWDCCKPSCGWSGKATVTSPVKTCAQNGIAPVDVNAQSGCNGGPGYMCNNQQPWNVSSTLSYGYAAANIAGQTESDWCCACYSLVFTTGPVAGKELIVQVTNTGGDLGNNHFDLQMPGGGVGIFDGCSKQFPEVSKSSWGQQYGGISQRLECDKLPAVLRAGCYWRFDWFMNADNPKMRLKQVTCPSVLTANTGCTRK